MLDPHLRISNHCWRGECFLPTRPPAADGVNVGTWAELGGRFAFAQRSDERVILARDPLGLNKLFFAIHEQRGVVAANYLADLRIRGVPFEAIYAVPAGTSIEIAVKQQMLICRRFHVLKKKTSQTSADPSAVLARTRNELGHYFERLSQQFPTARIAVCLSGGLDSALVAAIAREYFSGIIAYTYSYNVTDGDRSEDVSLAQETAAYLGLPFRQVQAGRADVLGALRDAVFFAQDWRDFNVHCAIVNVLLADAIARDAKADAETSEILVLTGDLMNELLADYEPVWYRGKEYYGLPEIDPESLRLALVRGLQTGDREVGVFQSRGLTAIQPYGAVFRSLLLLPCAADKRDVIRTLAGNLLPTAFYRRVKVRAQIGDTEVKRGILPLLIDSGRDGEWLERFSCDVFGVPDPRVLRNFIRAGIYRPCQSWPPRRCGQSGYLKI
ncbi:MAG: asparagine synthase family protein [Egibacteraceae bacterium]